MKLPKNLLEEFSYALQEAYPNINNLDQMLYYSLDINRFEISTNNGLRAIIFDLIQWFQARDKTSDFLIAARQSNPDNIRLLKIADKLHLSVELVKQSQNANLFTQLNGFQELEREIVTSNPYLDINIWNKKLGMIEGQVCRIEYKNKDGLDIYGTGFLVGPNCLITNYHVMADVIENKADSKNVNLRFDYKMLSDGTTINSGSIFKLDERDWLIDFSKYSYIDTLINAQNQLPKKDELDYALLGLKEDIGNRPIGKTPEPNAKNRGWMDLSNSIHKFEQNSPLIIVQHPKGNPLKLVLDTNAIIGTNSNHTRVWYRTNTESGSSGSPCFDTNLELVAIHHSGDPNFEPFYKPTYNEGIPLSSIFQLLSERGKDSFLERSNFSEK